jgi:aminoglycoside phosphotransferase (APT) family kinase protein
MTQGLDLENVRTRLIQWFKGKMPEATEITLSGLDKPSAGLSNETYSFELRWKEAGLNRQQKLVIRWVPPRYPLYPKYDAKEQFLVFKHLEAAGIPVPKALWLEEDPSVIGRQFYIVEHAEGWIPPENPPYHVAGPLIDFTPERRARIWNKVVEVMAKIHTLDWRRAGMDFLGVPKAGTDPIDRHIAYFEKIMSSAIPPTDPVLDAAKEWLKKNVPAPKYVSLCWGDARLGNVIFRDDEVVAVLDWETAMLADAEAELAWMLHLD